MKNLIFGFAFLFPLLCFAQSEWKKAGSCSYRVLVSAEKSRPISSEMFLLLGMNATAKKTNGGDTVIFNTQGNEKPFYIPANEPSMGAVLCQLREFDSVEFVLPADTLYIKSFGVNTTPVFIEPGSLIHFNVKIVKAYNQTELQLERQKETEKRSLEDKIAINNYIKTQKNIKSTGTGLKYVVLKSNPKGKKVSAGNIVQVHYKGWLPAGDVFDQNKESDVPFEFTVGAGGVIKGWDEGLALMHEGETFRFVIPWSLAYGSSGTGPIPPFSSLIFDVKLVGIK